jgi:hypothetical protein
MRQSHTGLDLRRARALLRLSEALAEDSAGRVEGWLQEDLRSAQIGFYRNCRDAERRSREDGRTVAQQNVSDQLDQLLKENLKVAQNKGFSQLRADAENAARSSTLASRELWAPRQAGDDESSQLGDLFFGSGRLVYLMSEPESVVPQYQLESATTLQVRHLLGKSAIVLLLALVAWMLPRWPRVVEWIVLLWPIELAGLSALAWLLLGPNWIPILPFLTGSIAGLFYLARWFFGFLRRPGPALATSGTPESSAAS